jgi:hypothetical protein
VTKVGGGHNCWLSANSACGDTMTVWIRNWAGSASGAARPSSCRRPPTRTWARARPSRQRFGAVRQHDPSAGALRQYCARCHSSNAGTPQSPFFADANADAAYAAARSKINLDNPAISRLVVRLREEFHNCWTTIAARTRTRCRPRMTAFSNGIQVTQVDPNLVLSKALTLYDGTVAAGGNRFETNQIALWEFKTGMGTVAFDTSGVEPAINLNFTGDVTWLGGWGIKIGAGGKAQGSTTAARSSPTRIKARANTRSRPGSPRPTSCRKTPTSSATPAARWPATSRSRSVSTSIRR